MKTLTASNARKQFFDLLTSVHDDSKEFIITKGGEPFAKMVPFKKKWTRAEAMGSLAGMMPCTVDNLENVSFENDWEMN